MTLSALNDMWTLEFFFSYLLEDKGVSTYEVLDVMMKRLLLAGKLG